jgi:hypothetical protein
MVRKALAAIAMPIILVACEGTATAPLDTPEAGSEPARADRIDAQALHRSVWPTAQDPGPPYYARVEPAAPHLYTVDGLAVIAFYRQPSCIPEDFNLLAFFDAPRAFGCPLTVNGFSLWEGEPFMGAPRASRAVGAGDVPFWFIPANAAAGALADGVLTITELTAIDGRVVGHATLFTETLQPGPVPLPPPLGGGGHPVPKLSQVARGVLEDGRTFWYSLVVVDHDQVTIRLRFE